MQKQPYIKGEQGGWDKKAQKWRRRDGKFSTEERALMVQTPQKEFGYFVEAPAQSNLVTAAEHIERLISGVDPSKLQAAIYAAEGTDPIPTDILAMMELAEYYTKVEGDIHQVIEAPMQIGLRELRVSSKDDAVEQEFRDLYDEGVLDMEEVMYGIWYCMEVYGQAYPLELYDDMTPAGVYLLNPKSMEVGRSVSYGHFSLDIRVPPSTWEEDIKKQTRPDLFFRSLGDDFNEHAQKGHLPINPEYCTPVRYTALPFKRYAIPPLARAYRSISTRQVLEELIRATIEGYRNQLWVFKIGDKDLKPNPDKIEFFHSLIAGSVGDRTGYLVWDYALQVECHAPEALDSMMGNERWLAITAHIFRQLGISTRIISGEAPMGATRTGEELDVKILLARLEWVRSRCMRWLRGWNRRYAERQNSPAMLKNMPKVEFGEDFIEIEQLVKGFIQPMIQFGKISDTTALEKLGLDYPTELKRKQDEAPYAGMFGPQASYAQYVPTKDKNLEYTPEGRPPEGTAPRKPVKVEAAEVEDHERRIMAAYDMILAASLEERADAIAAFRDTMRSLNREYIGKGYIEGYQLGGGFGEPEQARIDDAIRWNDNYLDNFVEDLLTNSEDERIISGWKNRAKLYAREGHKKGFMVGIFQAMEEHGARGWRRVLHPELSESGPCDDCIADSKLIHPITEPFFDHVFGVCSTMAIYFYRGVGSTEIPLGFPVPYVPGEKHIVRRVREW